jgi:hypothetical protein
MKKLVFLIVAIIAIGAAGLTTAILSSEQVDAGNCKDEFRPCHGCSHESQGEEASDGRCSHEERRH